MTLGVAVGLGVGARGDVVACVVGTPGFWVGAETGGSVRASVPQATASAHTPASATARAVLALKVICIVAQSPGGVDEMGSTSGCHVTPERAGKDAPWWYARRENVARTHGHTEIGRASCRERV